MKTSELNDQVEFLRSFALFSELSDSDLKSLSTVTQDLDLDPGVTLLTQNEPADAVYFLKNGAVKILVNGEMVAQIDKAQCFGEMSCLTPETVASATVVTAKQSQLIRIAKDDFLNSVSQNFKLWKMLFQQMSTRVRSLNGRLSEVLNHLPQGLIKVFPDGTVSNDYSVQCSKFFQKEDLAGISFPKLAFPNDETKQHVWLDNLSLLFSENNMSFEMCAGLLTAEFHLVEAGAKKHFAMTYAPCKDAVGKIIAVDIGIEDVTRQKELERQNGEIKRKQEMLSKITQGPDSFLNFLAFSTEVYGDTETFVTQLKAVGAGPVKARVEHLMRRLHSLKGISGVYSLQGMKATVHELESMVSRVREPREDLVQLVPAIEAELETFKIQKEKARGIFDEMPSDLRKRLLGVIFSQEEFQSVKSSIAAGDLVSVRKVLSSVEKVDSKKLVAQWPEEAAKIAAEIEKSVEFSVGGEGGRLSQSIYAELDKVLIHLLRNGLDHGLETPEERLLAGKAETGRITAIIDVSDHQFLMVVEDDGRGLNGPALAKRAKQNSNLDQALIDQYIASSQEWKILLMPGFSTAKEVTDLSGRGVGLDAVASAIAAMGGSLTIESTFGEGTCMFISVPIAE